ncbi:MAG TPA: calcium-binding protein [Rhizomicrobium sp.]|jgi:Ca2+-binding RTX toxin-like protein
MATTVITSANSIDNTATNGSGIEIGGADAAIITSSGYVIASGNGGEGIYMDGTSDDAQLTVAGLVSGTQEGVYALGTQDQVTVTGEVFGGVRLEGTFASLSVGATGVISGEVDLGGASDGLTNDGDILLGDDVMQFGASADVYNTGTISSNGLAMIYDGSGQVSIHNTGTITGDFDVVTPGDSTSAVFILNSGHWAGDLDLTAGDDTVINTGTIDGDIKLGDGNNTYNGANGMLLGEISAGAGNDTITGGAENDTITGGAGTDVLDGGGGINTVVYSDSTVGVYVDLSLDIAKRGTAAGDKISHFQNVIGSLGNDTLIGDDSDNSFNGVLGSDHMTGNGGNDTLEEEASAHAVLSGGDGNDLILMKDADATDYGHALVAADQLDGGAGYDTLEINGNYYSTTFVFHATTMVNVEQIDLDPGNGYRLQTDNATVAAGQTLTVDGSALGVADHLVFNGAAETDGHFIIDGGAGVDTLTGGSDGDTFEGGGYGDRITLGAGADTLLYNSVEDSTSTLYDTISGFNAAKDIFNLTVAVAAINTGVSATVSTATISTDLKNAANGHLLAGDAILITANAGTLSGHVFLIVDANGTAGYQSHGDYVMDITGYTGTLSVADFVTP